MQDHRDTITKGVIGVSGSLFGLIVASLDEVELILKIASLAIGCLVGFATFISIICKMRRDSKRYKQEVEELGGDQEPQAPV